MPAILIEGTMSERINRKENHCSWFFLIKDLQKILNVIIRDIANR